MRGLFLKVLLATTAARVCVLAVTPTGELQIRQSSTVIYLAPGNFGDDLPDSSDTIYRKLVRPLGDSDGCSPEVPTLFPKNSQFYLLVQRGNCTFTDKAIAAENVGAKGVIIYNSLEGIYQGMDYADSIDYECNNGEAYVAQEDIISPIYSSEMDDAMPTSCTQNSQCASGRCVFTNATEETSGARQVCCAWDLYVTMGDGSDESSADITIPAVFVRMEDEDTLSTFSSLDSLTMDVMVFKRSTWAVDVSSILIWLIAVVTVGIGAVRAAEEDKMLLHAPSKGDQRERDYYTESDSEPIVDYNNTLFPRILTSSAAVLGAADSPIRTGSRDRDSDRDSLRGGERDRDRDRDRDSDGDRGGGLRLPVYRVRGRIVHGDSEAMNQENTGGSLDITAWHALGFVAISSMFLTLLYFVDLYQFVTVMYLVAAALAVCLVSVHPLLREGVMRIHELYTGTPHGYVPIGDASLLEPAFLAALAVGGLVAGTWYYFRDTSWAWLVQDYMGITVCMMFLSTVRLPNLKVATLLLCLAFCYDIFFVFISPYVFSSSVMLSVATGTTTTHSDENYCEKYPDDADCQDTSLPMMLTVPTFSSYLNSDSILGLGDIVLPGLLLVWCARFDMRRHGTLQSEKASQGYFPMALFGYSAGLMLANLAVDYFDAGQPALLYIVPLTLGPVLWRSSRAHTLMDLWLRLPAMKTVALPLDREEQERLLSRPDVVAAVASWTDKSKTRVITLTGQPIVPLDLNQEAAAGAGLGAGSGDATDVEAGAISGGGGGGGGGGGSSKKKRKGKKSSSDPATPEGLGHGVGVGVEGSNSNDLGLL